MCKKNSFWAFANHPTEGGVGELAGGGFMTVALNVSDMSQVTGDMRHMTGDR